MPCPVRLRCWVGCSITPSGGATRDLYSIVLASGQETLYWNSVLAPVSSPWPPHSVLVQGRFVAVDIQPEMIKRVEQRVRTAGLANVETHTADAYHLPLADGSVDRAFLISVLEEIPDPVRALAELSRVLKPEGILSITAEFMDPDYWFPIETIRQLQVADFALVKRFGNLWCYTLNFRKVERQLESTEQGRTPVRKRQNGAYDEYSTRFEASTSA